MIKTQFFSVKLFLKGGLHQRTIFLISIMWHAPTKYLAKIILNLCQANFILQT